MYRMVKSCISTEYTMYILNVRSYFLLQYSYPDDGDLHTDTCVQVDLKKTSSNLIKFYCLSIF